MSSLPLIPKESKSSRRGGFGLKRPAALASIKPTATAATAQSGLKWETATAAEDEEPLSPMARVYQTPNFNFHIIAMLGFKTRINVDLMKAGLEDTLVKHRRFSSKLVIDDKRGGQKKWVRTAVNIDDHIVVPDIDPRALDSDGSDRYVEDYVSDITKIPMDFSKPLWEFHILNIKTSDAEAVAVLRVHHSMGDGTSLIHLLISCTRKASDPDSLPTFPAPKRAGSGLGNSGGWFRSVFRTLWLTWLLFWNTFLDTLWFVATIVFLKDTDTPIKGGPGVEHSTKRFVRRTVSLDDIKLVKRATNTTINDVALGVTQAGLARYLNRRYAREHGDKGAAEDSNDVPNSILLRSAVYVNIRATTGVEATGAVKNSKFKWGNHIGYVILPFAVDLPNNPLDSIDQVKATMDRKKFSQESIFSYYTTNVILNLFGEKAAAVLMHRAMSNTTMSFSNVVGPLEEICFHGHRMAFLAVSVYGHPQTLMVHFQSYTNKMTIAVAVDEDAIPDPHKLCDDFEESLNLMKAAVLQKKG